MEFSMQINQEIIFRIMDILDEKIYLKLALYDHGIPKLELLLKLIELQNLLDLFENLLLKMWFLYGFSRFKCQFRLF